MSLRLLLNGSAVQIKLGDRLVLISHRFGSVANLKRATQEYLCMKQWLIFGGAAVFVCGEGKFHLRPDRSSKSDCWWSVDEAAKSQSTSRVHGKGNPSKGLGNGRKARC